MKKLILLSLLFFTHLVFAQTWDGSLLPTGNTYRTGNVGIGTDNPQARLHVQTNGEGSILSKSTETGGYGAANVIVDAANATYPGRFMFRESGVNRAWMDYLGGKINIRNGSGNALFTVLTSDGNVGIGATLPNAKLSIRDGGDGAGIFNFDWTYENDWGGDSNKWAGYIGFNAYRANGVAKDNYLRANSHTKRLVFEAGNSGFRWLGENNVPNPGSSTSYLQLSELMTLKTNGFLGIGSKNPDELLTVKGTIHCEEVKVDLAVPADYVFESYYTGHSLLKPDYVMPTLEEVEAFTKANNHLPDVPSAKEIQENGLQLKEMTNLLLQKIEELTLYTIEQDKKLKLQQEQINELKEVLNKNN